MHVILEDMAVSGPGRGAVSHNGHTEGGIRRRGSVPFPIHECDLTCTLVNARSLYYTKSQLILDHTRAQQRDWHKFRWPI